VRICSYSKAEANGLTRGLYYQTHRSWWIQH